MGGNDDMTFPILAYNSDQHLIGSILEVEPDEYPGGFVAKDLKGKIVAFALDRVEAYSALLDADKANPAPMQNETSVVDQIMKSAIARKD
jgi:hypothetical protein